MLKLEILAPLLTLIRQTDGGGLSSYELSKALNIRESTARYYLNIAEKDSFLIKKQSKYLLKREFFMKQGCAIYFSESNDAIFVNCPYRLKGCPCEGIVTNDCKFYKELPSYMKKLIMPLPQ